MKEHHNSPLLRWIYSAPWQQTLRRRWRGSRTLSCCVASPAYIEGVGGGAGERGGREREGREEEKKQDKRGDREIDDERKKKRGNWEEYSGIKNTVGNDSAGNVSIVGMIRLIACEESEASVVKE